MNRLHKFFVLIGFIGFVGMFFIAGASDGDRLNIDQLFYLCMGSAAAMVIGIVGYLLSRRCGPDDI